MFNSKKQEEMTASKIQIKKICECCGKEFIAFKTSTRYCSKQCNCKAYKLKLRKQQVCAAEFDNQERHEAKKADDVKEMAFLSTQDAARLLGISHRSVYNLIYKGVLRAGKVSCRMTFIRREDIEIMLETNPYQKRHKKERAPITEFYTTAEVKEKYKVADSWIFVVAKRENIPRVFQRGKTLWSKKHIDDYFSKKVADANINEWYSVKEVMDKFNMSIYAVYTFVSKNNIPKKKDKREVFYSKKHIEVAKGIIEPEIPQYYTIPEAMARFNMTRDQIYHYAKFHNIPKVKEGKYTKISKKELDELLAPPII